MFCFASQRCCLGCIKRLLPLLLLLVDPAPVLLCTAALLLAAECG
jgi:hypothetical protein